MSSTESILMMHIPVIITGANSREPELVWLHLYRRAILAIACGGTICILIHGVGPDQQFRVTARSCHCILDEGPTTRTVNEGGQPMTATDVKFAERTIFNDQVVLRIKDFSTKKFRQLQ
jgi:hypothetical protein